MSNSIEFLNALANNLRQQDNQYTRLPVYEVQEKVRIYGICDDYTDSFEWICDSEIVTNDESEEYTRDQLEAMQDNFDFVPDEYDRVGYIEREMCVATFFTQKAAEKYMASNSHRHEGELRMYVSSAYRNPEWAELRRLLAGPLLDCLFALQDVTEELRQLHAHHYASCEGGCPANSYIEKAKQVLANLDTYKDPYA